MAISSDFSSLSRGTNPTKKTAAIGASVSSNPNVGIQGSSRAKITRDSKGSLQAQRDSDFKGPGSKSWWNSGKKSGGSSSNATSGASVGGSFTPSYSGPKGKVSYGKSSAIKKK